MSEGFANSIIGGAETLIRSAIKSFGYVAGVFGWRISREGSAEFNDLVARGEINVVGSNGSYIRAFANSGQAEIDMMPPSSATPGVSFLPGTITATSDTDVPLTVIRGASSYTPVVIPSGQLNLGSDPISGHSTVYLAAEKIDIGSAAVNSTCHVLSETVTIQNDNLQDSRTHQYMRGENGSFLASFTALDATTFAVTFSQSFSSTPFVKTNINAGSAATARWQSRAINATANGFTYFVYASTSGLTSTWSNVSVSWEATEYTP